MKLKFIAPAALAVLLAGGLVGCGGDDPNAVIVWATATEQAVLNDVVKLYNEQANDADKVSIKYVAVAEGDTGTEVAKDPSAATAPDLFLCADDHIYSLQSKNIVVDLTSGYQEKVKKNNNEVAVTGASYNGHLYGFPVTSDNGYFLWYDGDVLGTKDVETLEGILAKAKEKGKKVLIDLPNGWYSPTFYFPKEVCGPDSLKFKEDKNGDVIYDISWDNEKGVAASEAVAKLLKDYKGTVITGGNDVIVAGFTDKTLCAAVSGAWMEADLVGVCSKLAATKLPTFAVGTTKAQMATFTGSKIYCINGAKVDANAQARRDKATKLADFLTQKEAQLIRFEKRQAAPCNIEAAKDDRYTKHVSIGIKALNDQVQACAAVQATAAEGRYWDVGKAIGQALFDSNLGAYTTWKDFLKFECDSLRSAA